MIARALHETWCGLLFVPAYQLKQAAAFIRALNPKTDREQPRRVRRHTRCVLVAAAYVEPYVKRLVCIEDLIQAIRSAKGFSVQVP